MFSIQTLFFLQSSEKLYQSNQKSSFIYWGGVFANCNSQLKYQQYLDMQGSDFTESADLTFINNTLRDRIAHRLSHLWREHNVDKIFQDIFMESLGQTSASQFSKMTREEGELTVGQQSFGFSLQTVLQARVEALKRVDQAVRELEGKENKTERDIDFISTLLKDLREANLQAAQLMLNIDRYFSETLGQNCFSPTLANQMERLDSENAFLRLSILRKFILFSKSYDPFLLKHEEALRTTHNPRLKELKSIEVLFTLPISYVYRLEKAQKGCLEYIARGKPIFSQGIPRQKTKKFRIISPVRQGSRNKQYKYFLSPKKELLEQLDISSGKLDDELNSFRLEKQIYITNRNRVDSSSRDFETMRKGSGDQITTTPSYSYSTRIRNSSIKSNKDSQLPKLKTINSETLKDTHKQAVSLTKRYNAYQSINQMEQRSKELKNFAIPKKFDQMDGRFLRETCPDPTLRVSPNKYSPPKEISNEVFIKCEAQQITLPRGSSLRKTEDRTESSPPSQKSPSSQRQSPILELPKGKYKKYQLKAGRININKFMQNFRKLPFNPEYTRIISVGSWENSILHNQYYFHKFFVNEELSAVALSCALPQGDVLIKCWAPLVGCDREMSEFLFGKYVEHIEKTTFCITIFYNNLPIDELTSFGFQRKKERIYERQRVLPSLCQKGEYSPFLVLNFSSVAVGKNTPSQERLLTKGQAIEQYNSLKFLCFNYLLMINKLMNAGSFSSVAAYHPHLPSIRESNNRILSQSLSASAYNSDFKCSYCHLLTLKLKNPIKYAFFVANQGYIKLFGELISETKDSVIVVLPLLRYNVRMFFGRGLQSAEEMMTRCRQPPKEKSQKIDFSIKMFRKRLRGRMQGINLKQQNTYGDFQLTFSWQDFLKGNIEHPIKDADQVFDSNFYCLLEMQREMLFVFEVTPADFIQ